MVKKIREVLLVALVLCFCISHTAFAQAEKPIPNYQIIENITPEKAYSLIQLYREGCPCNRENFIIIDVRTPEEYANGYIENAINLDYYSETFKDGLKKLDKNKTYLIFCRSGRRTRTVLDIMKELGFTDLSIAIRPVFVPKELTSSPTKNEPKGMVCSLGKISLDQYKKIDFKTHDTFANLLTHR